MQGSSSSMAQPEAILDWLQKEMGYRPLGSYSASSKSQLPSVDAFRKVCRGNMIPIWNFLITRVKSEKTVENIRRNIMVHGGGGGGAGESSSGGSANSGKEEGRVVKGRRKDKVAAESPTVVETREVALQERELAAKEVERLRNAVKRQRKDLKARMLEVSREEAERKRMLDERANYSSDLFTPRPCLSNSTGKQWHVIMCNPFEWMPSKVRGTYTNPWRGISNELSSFPDFVHCFVGDGKELYFWENSTVEELRKILIIFFAAVTLLGWFGVSFLACLAFSLSDMDIIGRWSSCSMERLFL
ncbi:AUGMIN subunit 5 [Cucumis melo var. makuwa]|uniref:AUGMIN subunit 5 n=1 Tax=Cucumis melo var. makuwa TaxID=1194695 RepID=A0A5D3DBN0_CUCMM|nr:AUGMIN subunit 5 [Cucumis melo var. makuwa]